MELKLRLHHLFHGIAIASLGIVISACGDNTQSPPPIDEALLIEQTNAIHQRVMTIDSHDDIPLNFATSDVDPLNADRQVNLNKMRTGGLDVAFFSVYVPQTVRTQENYLQARLDAITKFEAIRRMTDELYPDQIALATTADEAVEIYEQGKLVAAIGIENGFAINQDLSLLERYRNIGASYMTLAHNGNNDIADSAQPLSRLGDTQSENQGLSPFGAEVIAEMNRIGIMVDISHISKDAALQAIALSTKPVIASHSNVRAIADHPRNLDDETLLALKENGGVLQTVAYTGFVKRLTPEQLGSMQAVFDLHSLENNWQWDNLSDEEREAMSAQLREIGAPSVEDLVDHIDYAVNLIGIDHVGISSDFDGGGGIIGWSDASETQNVTLELVRRGYSQDDIEKLWGGNLLRVWREATS